MQAESLIAAMPPYPATPRLRALLAYWDDLRGAAFAPPRSALRPAEIPRLLPCLLLAEPVPGSDRFRVRLAGTHVVNGLGGDPTGHELDPEAGGPLAALLLDRLCEVQGQRRPASFGPARSRGRGGEVLLREGLVLPLSANGKTVNMILAGLEMAPRSRIGPLAPV